MAAPHSPLKAPSGPQVAPSQPRCGSTDFLLSTPPQVLQLLAHAAPLLRGTTEAARVLTWDHPNRWASFSVLLAWWTVCLFGDRLARYGLNAVAMAALGAGWLLNPPKRPRLAIQAMDPDKLADVLEDARQCQHALSNLYATFLDPLVGLFAWHQAGASRRLLRLLCTSYPAYLAFTYFVGTRYLLLILGSVLFLSPSKFARAAAANIRRSFVLRLVCNLVFSICIAGGEDLQRLWSRTKNAKLLFLSDLQAPRDSASSAASEDSAPLAAFSVQETKATAASDGQITFTFTIYQNERWWIGLDWTQALLPSERPAWCDSRSNALPPPSAFALPSPMLHYIPSPTKKHPDAAVQRCIRWEWIDPDWHVRPDSHSSVPVEAKASETVDLSKQSTPPMSGPGGVADWARGKMAAATATGHQRRSSWAVGASSSWSSSAHTEGPPPPSPQPSPLSGSAVGEEDDDGGVGSGLSKLPKGAGLDSERDADWVADGQGWAYGDNSWERMTNRPGMGKFTRRRAWVRRARVVESSKLIEEPEDRATGGLRKRG